MNTEKRPLVILVDDEPHILKVYGNLLARWYEVSGFSSGPALLSEIAQLQPAVIVIDWLMPEMDGIDLCRELRKSDWLDQVPFAFFTGIKPSVANMEAAFEVGAEVFIEKGANAAVVLAQIRALANAHERLESNVRVTKTMFSLIKHDLANCLTGVITGVEVMGMHDAFQDEGLRSQLADTELWGEQMRDLLDDMGDLLTITNRGKQEKIQELLVSDILEHTRRFLQGCRVRADFADAGDATISCMPRRTARALYYLCLLYAAQTSPEASVNISVENTGGKSRLVVTGDKDVHEQCKKTFFGEIPTDRQENRESILPVLFIRSLMHLGFVVTMESAGGKTRLCLIP